jgi:hypothetical protein
METFRTRFVMSGVPTDVTVQTAPDDAFNCTLNLADFFDGGEFEGADKEPDVTLKSLNGKWQIVGDSKVTLTTADVENLGQAIDEDYLSK